MPVTHLNAVNLDNRHKVAKPSTEVVIHASIVHGIDVDLRPTHALVGAHLKQQLTRFIAEVTRNARIENHSLLHNATLGPWYMNRTETRGAAAKPRGNSGRPDAGTVEE